MYGKYFASTFTGSMFGAGADVFAVWGYIIAHTKKSQVELNPFYVAAVLGSTPEAVKNAINFLCAPDVNSRTKGLEGRRLVREGEFAYRVPNHEVYRAMRCEDDRREYNRVKKAESRQRDKLKQKKKLEDVNVPVNDSQAVNTPVNESQHIPEPIVEQKKISSTFLDSSSLRSEESKNSDSSSEDARPDTGIDASEPEATEAVAGAPEKKTREVPAARTVFDAYRAILCPKAAFDEKRRKIIAARLKDFTVEQLCRVPLGAKHTPWNMGKNPSNRKYIDVDLLYRDADKVEFFLAQAGMAETLNGNTEQQADIAAQEACGCYEMGGLRKVGEKYLPCNHSAVPILEPLKEAVWPPPVK